MDQQVKVSGAKVIQVCTSLQGTRAATLDIPGLMLIAPKSFGDSRGYFLESWNAARYAELGIVTQFVQDNLSCSARGVLRGLHFQEPEGQAKLVSVIAGEVFDVAVDVRHGSPTFGRWAGVHLTGENRWQFFVPRGFAHGFCVLSETAYFNYKCDRYYAPQFERSVQWSDPDLEIIWPLANPSLSPKDQVALKLCDIDQNQLPVYLTE